MGEGLTREMAVQPAALKGAWRRDRVHGGVTRRDGRYNLKSTGGKRGTNRMIAVRLLEGEPKPKTLGYVSTIERAVKRIERHAAEFAEVERRAEYDASNRWMFDLR